MANDHDGLAAKEFIQAPSMMFNRATKRKLSWDLQYLYNCAFTQVRKSNHSLAKLYTSILYHDLYAKVRTWGLTAKELADLRTRFVALGNIFAQKQKSERFTIAVDFCKAFDIVSRPIFISGLESLDTLKHS